MLSTMKMEPGGTTSFHVVVLGTSVLLAAITASLHEAPQLRVTQIDPRSAHVRQQLRDATPHSLIVERRHWYLYYTNFDLTLPIIEIDTECSFLLVRSAYKVEVSEMSELLDLIAQLVAMDSAPMAAPPRAGVATRL
jgi:hypothetical protein